MKHSNNAARIRIWRQKKGVEDAVDRTVIGYADLKTPEFASVNPLMKVPALVLPSGSTIFESPVILEYLEEKYAEKGPSFKPENLEDRARMNLMLRIHDLYIASPNCTQPGFSHTQGCMYLSTAWHGAARAMDIDTRAAKLRELWQHLVWMEENMDASPFLVGDQMTLADMTWFPTTIFMEFLLPRVFGWHDIFNEGGTFPKFTKWFTHLRQDPVFESCRQDIWEYWETMEAEGQFEPIKEELKAKPHYKWNYTDLTYLANSHLSEVKWGPSTIAKIAINDPFHSPTN